MTPSLKDLYKKQIQIDLRTFFAYYLIYALPLYDTTLYFDVAAIAMII